MSLSLTECLLEMVRRPPPVAEVVTGSTPVVAFGNLQKATVATLGINPSLHEFLGRDGTLLSGPKRRLATLSSLDVEDVASLEPDHIRRVIDDCATYFRPDRNPYGHWFNPLDEVLRTGLGVSFYDDTACHLDLVQWATQPVWSALPNHVRQILLANGLPHLQQLLRRGNIRVVLLNGRQVIDHVLSARLACLHPCGKLQVNARLSCSLYCGESEMIRFIGWSSNLQSSRGIGKDFRSRLSVWLSALFKGKASVTEDTKISQDGGDFDPHGYIAKRTVVGSKSELHHVFEQWLKNANAPTIGQIGEYGRRPLISISLGKDRTAVLNADTKRAAVAAYVNDARARGADVPWSILPTRRSRRWNKLTFRADGEEEPGWCCYLRPDATGRGQV